MFRPFQLLSFLLMFSFPTFLSAQNSEKEAYQWYVAGALKMENGDYSSALSSFNKAVELDDSKSIYFSARAECLISLNDNEGGISDCEKALLLNSDNQDAHVNYSWALLNTWRFEEALQQADKAINGITGNDELLSMAYCNKGSALIFMDRFEEAGAALQQSITLRESNELAYLNMGNLYLKMNEFEMGELMFLQAIYLKEDLPEAYWGLGLAAMAQSNIENACKAFSKAKEMGFYYEFPNGDSSNSLIEELCN